MARTKIEIVGALRFSEEDGLKFSLPLAQRRNGRIVRTGESVWLEAFPLEREWPGVGKFPEKPKPKSLPQRPGSALSDEGRRILEENKAAEEEWERARKLYMQALHASPEYRRAASEYLEAQRREPQRVPRFSTVPRDRFTEWCYRDKVVRVESTEPEALRNDSSDSLLIKHYILRRERHYHKVRREVEALENLEKLEGASREPIPEAVRLFVWQRDQGRCVKCGSRERLEFDHIIPVAAGGSSTERNVQLLCEACNRSKGSEI